MKMEDLKNLVKNIIEKATALKNKHIDDKNTPVNYACIFSQSKEEYDELVEASRKIGKVIQETPTGLLFHIEPLETVSGVLKLLKIRIPDTTRPERGDADFTISNFPEFEKKYLSKSGFKILRKPDFYMVELMDSDFDVRAYFSNPPLDRQLNI
ncbi:hypothetical protein COS78_02415 [Candidatus Shapirobacteria bacterium CG06_land_8_20_14_3_00_40_12]|uniref:Uncharacterized protein n=1 Tax=Candidatus Shapirobacteria bacterium CG06_land_8_20_14_3_00_40_12 TaxID=1974881 RepID=A0A2M7AS21_9BACT|nr:MAG: hypothetical protein COS78_02415 [Candidatus Shapirobacteria bacterium CG06_land_8_20_14_3_00_40_12]